MTNSYDDKFLDLKIIGSKIKERRKYMGITQEQIADYVGVNASHLSNLECGRVTPSLTILLKIANYLQCSIDVFIDHQYTFEPTENTDKTLDDRIVTKLKYFDVEKKEKILKMMDII